MTDLQSVAKCGNIPIRIALPAKSVNPAERLGTILSWIPSSCFVLRRSS